MYFSIIYMWVQLNGINLFKNEFDMLKLYELNK